MDHILSLSVNQTDQNLVEMLDTTHVALKKLSMKKSGSRNDDLSHICLNPEMIVFDKGDEVDIYMTELLEVKCSLSRIFRYQGLDVPPKLKTEWIISSVESEVLKKLRYILAWKLPLGGDFCMYLMYSWKVKSA